MMWLLRTWIATFRLHTAVFFRCDLLAHPKRPHRETNDYNSLLKFCVQLPSLWSGMVLMLRLTLSDRSRDVRKQISSTTKQYVTRSPLYPKAQQLSRELLKDHNIVHELFCFFFLLRSCSVYACANDGCAAVLRSIIYMN